MPGVILSSYQKGLAINIIYIINDIFARCQDITFHIRERVISIINVYVPHNEYGHFTIYCRLLSHKIQQVDYRDPVQTLYYDLADKVKSLHENVVII